VASLPSFDGFAESFKNALSEVRSNWIWNKLACIHGWQPGVKQVDLSMEEEGDLNTA
jgi:hypothetical protein